MTRVIVPPAVIELDGALVHILEVTEREWIDKTKHYLVTCYVEIGNYRSQVFTLDVTSNEELKEKLRVEIAKMKFMLLSGKTNIFFRHT